jgi:signal peptidase II
LPQSSEETQKFMKTEFPHSFYLFFYRLAIFFLVAFAGVFADLATKSWVFQRLGMEGLLQNETPKGIYWVLPDIFGFQTSLNQGALFGMGQGKIVWLVILSGVFLVGIVGWMFHSAWNNRTLTVTLGLIVAGIIGNLYDRIGLHGLQWENGEPVYGVRDWILVMLGSFTWPNFNIADSMLVCGAILLVFHTYLHEWTAGNGNRQRKCNNDIVPIKDKTNEK